MFIVSKFQSRAILATAYPVEYMSCLPSINQAQFSSILISHLQDHIHFHHNPTKTMPSSTTSHDLPPAYTEDDPVPCYTEEVAPTPAFGRLDRDLEGDRPYRPIRAPPRTYIPTGAPSIRLTQTVNEQSINLTSRDRPYLNQLEEDEDFGTSSQQRMPQRTSRSVRKGSGPNGRDYCCVILVLVVVLAIMVPLIVLNATKGEHLEDMVTPVCDSIVNGDCVGTWGDDENQSL
jgi:hypothetical protein